MEKLHGRPGSIILFSTFVFEPNGIARHNLQRIIGQQRNRRKNTAFQKTLCREIFAATIKKSVRSAALRRIGKIDFMK